LIGHGTSDQLYVFQSKARAREWGDWILPVQMQQTESVVQQLKSGGNFRPIL